MCICTSDKVFFTNKKYDSISLPFSRIKLWTCTELCEAFTFFHGNIFVQFDGMVYQQIVRIPMGTIYVQLILTDLILYCSEWDFWSHLPKYKRFDLKDIYNDTSRYLDDTFTIHNFEFEKKEEI